MLILLQSIVIASPSSHSSITIYELLSMPAMPSKFSLAMPLHELQPLNLFLLPSLNPSFTIYCLIWKINCIHETFNDSKDSTKFIVTPKPFYVAILQPFILPFQIDLEQHSLIYLLSAIYGIQCRLQ